MPHAAPTQPVALVSRTGWQRGDPEAALLDREWLVTNGLGGFASGTLAGELTRRYHGLLVAALPAPLGRVVMLSRVDEELVLEDGSVLRPGGDAAPDGVRLAISSFRLDQGLPVWLYESGTHLLEKRVLMPHGQNTVVLCYRLLQGDGDLRVRLRPQLQVRLLEDPVSRPLGTYTLTSDGDRHEVDAAPGLPPLRLSLVGARSSVSGQPSTQTESFALEAARGYDSEGSLWSPGVLEVQAGVGSVAGLVASTESWEALGALPPDLALAAELHRRASLLDIAPRSAHQGPGAELVLAADQFLVTPAGRVAETARVHAEGDEVRTLIAGYHWFTDWGRDTMISLEGLTLATGRRREAGSILRTFAHYVQHGLIPNLFPDGAALGLYHTADATLWFFHALHRYVSITGDRTTLQGMLPVLREIVAWHVRGTDFNIGVDARDGLLHQGQAGYQLTWMDAKVGDWVVTPRRGKAVEIQALWYNALRLLESWLRDAGDASGAEECGGLAARAHASFNERFWFAAGGHCYDVVDGEEGDDPSCRPNQLLAFSLEHPVLEHARWEAVLGVVTERLLTPLGLRSLAPGSPGYHPRYFGDLRARDAAYHQGTVWGWLIGPYIDAWLRVHPGRVADARPLLDGLLAHLGEAGIGQMSEIFDAEPPYAPRGCIAQAWTVAEVLRCLERIRRGAVQHQR